MLLALAPLSAMGADRDESAHTVDAHELFQATAPYLDGPNEAAKRAVGEQCLMLDRRCIDFSSEQADVVLAAVPDNPDFWAAYAMLLAADPLPVESLGPESFSAFQGIIQATKAWLWRELATNGMADAARLHEQVSAHRRRLATSNYLLEKMIFLATTGVVLPAINVHMAHREARATVADRTLLDEMLKPMIREELSLRRAIDGELRYAAARMEELSEGDSPVQLDDLERVYGFVADRSEASWEGFWRHGLDVLANVEVPPEVNAHMPDWANYTANGRYLDASLWVLRALREMYEGRISPGPPATEAPYGWSWRWEEESQTLCLDPGYVHASVSRDEPASICHPYLVAANS